MNDKKKKQEKKKGNNQKMSPVPNNEEIIDFDGMRNTEEAKKEENSNVESKKKKTVEKEESSDRESETKETEKKEESSDRESEMKEAEKKEEGSDRESETKEAEKKEEGSDRESETKEAEKKEEGSDWEKETKEAEENTGKESENNKEIKKENIENERKNAIISQSKKLADAKAAMENDVKKVTLEENIKTNQSGKKKALWITFGALAGILFIVYIVGFMYFSGHYYQNVTINGIDVSGMNKEMAKQTLERFYQNYVITLETIDGEEIPIEGKDISMQITLHDEFDFCIKQQKIYLWFVNMFRTYEFQVGADTVWDETALDNIFDSMKILKKKNMKAPENAYIGVEDGRFTIVKEVMGTTIDTIKFKETVEKSLSNVLSIVVLKDADCYKFPAVYSTDESLKKDLEAKNAFATNEIKLQLDDLTIEPGMEIYDAVLEKKNGSYEVSEELVKKYVESLAEKYDTLGKERTITTSFDGKVIKMSGTAFGYEMNQEETAAVIYNALKDGKSTTIDVVFNKKGYTLKGENDIGDTYIEVNLSEQKVIAYKNGEKIAEGDCVSGNESAGNGTCTGLYAIQNKLSPTVLRGEKKPVTKTVTKKKKGKKVKVTKTTYEYEYESPVTFWMQFNGGIGLHDAAGWRSSYGGSIYYYSGSHGCVNLPYDLAEKLYKNFEIGDPVIVYFWDNENRK